MRDTIFALATAPGRAAVAVVRVSGPDSRRALSALAGGLPRPRYAALRTIKDPRSGEALDQALAFWFPGPASFTGEDQAELHLHGGRAAVDAVLEALAGIGLRPAVAGEFSRRAFENGKLDLVQAEGVADLIDAETHAQRRQALEQLQGALRGREAVWRRLLIDGLAFLEAGIDFPDEDVPGGVVDQARSRLRDLADQLTAAIGDARGERVREGFRVAILGRPNAGKSSLLNALARRDAAIVTPIPGTTRDVIEVALDIAGYRLVLADTAGLRVAEDAIEAEGMRRAQAWAADAALRLLVVDASEPSEDGLGEAVRLMRPGDGLVLNKMDRGIQGVVDQRRVEGLASGLVVVEASAAVNDIGQVEVLLERSVVEAMTGTDAPIVTRLRHRTALQQALGRLERGLSPGRAAELVAEDVRLAARDLEALSGRVGTEDVLDKVFAAFCIGK
jgi:tRNA modification GTPase